MTYIKQSWANGDSTTPINGTRLSHIEDGIFANDAAITAAAAINALKLTVATLASAGGTAVVNKHNPVDATLSSITTTLPTGQVAGSIIIVEKTDSSANTVTISGNIRGVGSSILVLALAKESIEFLADSTGSWWPIAGHKTLSSLKASITGGSSSSLVGFWGATPVVQPTAPPADATDLASAIALINSLKAKLRAVGLMA